MRASIEAKRDAKDVVQEAYTKVMSDMGGIDDIVGRYRSTDFFNRT